MNKSDCCNAPMKEEGIPDFVGDDYVCTVYYSCEKCNQPCDAATRKRRIFFSKDEILKFLQNKCKICKQAAVATVGNMNMCRDCMADCGFDFDKFKKYE